MTGIFDLTGKTALVTGGNRGIGFGIAEALARAGAGVAIWGRDADRNDRAAAELGAHGTEILSVTCDVSEEPEVERAFRRTVERLGGVDACFANAGIAGVAPSFMDLEMAEWRRIVRTNLEGAFLTLRAAARHMVERGEGGSLIATSSRLAASGQPRAQHYSASKGGLESMVRAIAWELGSHGIRANILRPGWIDTPMTAPVIDRQRVRDRVLPRIPAGRFGRPGDFAGLAVYLASDASAYHTGDSFIVDGGYVLT